MKIVFKVLAVVFALGFIGQLIAGNFFPIGLVLAIACGFFGWKESGEKVSENGQSGSQPIKDVKVLEESLIKIKELHSKSVFSDEELNKKTGELEKQIQSIKQDRENQSYESKVKESEEYKALVVLRSSQVINEEEFDEKVRKLVGEYSQKASSSQLTDNGQVEGEVNTDDSSINRLVYVSLAAIVLLLLMAAVGTWSS